MCGRYAITHTELIPGFFEVEDLRIPVRFNVAPTQFAPVVFNDVEIGKRIVDFMKWGLVPHWSKDVSIGSRMINARSETVASKPSFRGPFRHHRCLVPASGFFEWKQTSRGKQPYYFTSSESPLMGLAGIWDEYTDGETILYSYSIITRPADRFMSGYHNRMPVIVNPQDYAAWLSGDAGANEASRLIAAAPGTSLAARPVSTLVNNVRNDSPQCLEQLTVDG